jgi:hypothetical protein
MFYNEETELEMFLNNQAGRNRARTAPIKPMSDIEEFKRSNGFGTLEQAAVCAVQLVQRGDLKFDLDSFEGQNSCKKFLSHLEKLCETLGVKCSS